MNPDLFTKMSSKSILAKFDDFCRNTATIINQNLSDYGKFSLICFDEKFIFVFVFILDLSAIIKQTEQNRIRWLQTEANLRDVMIEVQYLKELNNELEKKMSRLRKLYGKEVEKTQNLFKKLESLEAIVGLVRDTVNNDEDSKSIKDSISNQSFDYMVSVIQDPTDFLDQTFRRESPVKAEEKDLKYSRTNEAKTHKHFVKNRRNRDLETGMKRLEIRPHIRVDKNSNQVKGVQHSTIPNNPLVYSAFSIIPDKIEHKSESFKFTSQDICFLENFLLSTNILPSIPEILVLCCEEIEDRSCLDEKLYLVNNSEIVVRDLRSKILDSDSGKLLLSNYDVHTITGVVKSFLRMLHEPIIPPDLKADFIRITSKFLIIIFLNIFFNFFNIF